MILACHNLNKAFGEHTIVKNGSFHIEDREKCAFVGVNGAGKSTVLKMIMGEETPDSGTIVLTRGKSIGYLAQQQNLDSNNTKRSKQPKPILSHWNSKSERLRKS